MFLSLIPLWAVHQGLISNAKNQGENLVSSIAKTMIQRADDNVSGAVSLMNDFALLGIASCRPQDLAHMRRMIADQFWVRDVAILNADGSMLCNLFGDAGSFQQSGNGIAARDGNVVMELAQKSGSREQKTMLTWSLASGNLLAAFLPGEAMAYDVIPKRMRDKGVAIVSLADGTLLNMAPRQEHAQAILPFDERSFSVTIHSEAFPYKVSVLAPFEVVWNDLESLYNKMIIGAIFLGVLFLGLLGYIMKPKRGRTNEIEEGIENGEFIPFYQPTFDVRTGELRGCEVLIRWRKPNGQILPPGTFIGLAEATGLAIPMTQALMVKVVDEMEDLHEQRPQLKIGINLFDDHFENLDIVEDIKHIFGPSKISYKQLMFEVTERQPLNDIERAKVVIRNMRGLGCQVALDDAGTGHGGLAYLQQLGFDVIKIDKLFIDAIGTDSFSAPIVDSLISLAEGLDMDIVAEGVEEPRQVEYLREKGVRLAQGYLFAKPLPYDKYKRLIEKMSPVIQRPEDRRRAGIRSQLRTPLPA